MAAASLYVFTGVLVFLVIRLRFERALMVAVASLLLVPAYLLLPVAAFPGTKITRIVFVAFAVSFHARRRRGEITADLRLPLLVLAAIAAATILAVSGIGLAGSGTDLRPAIDDWLIFVDQAVILWIGVVASRVLGPRRVADVLLGALAAALVVGAWEYLTDRSWSQLFPVTSSQSQILLSPLEERGGRRIRSGALFALEFGWVVAILVPLVFQRAVGRIPARWRAALVMALGSAAVIIIWTRSRSAIVAAGAGVALFVVLARFRRGATNAAVALAVVAGVILLATNSVEDVFEIERPEESTGRDVRTDRLPGILAEVAPDPLTGLGFGGLRAEGYITPDNGWLLLYADTGVVGVTAYAAAVVLALVVAGSALRGPPSPARDLAAAVVAGMVLWVVANGIYDASNLGLSGPLFWLLAGIGLVLSQRSEAPPRPLIPFPVLVGVSGLLLVGSVAAPLLTSTHVARTYQFQDVPTRILAQTEQAYTRPAYAAEATVCDAMNALDDARDDSSNIDCVDPGVYQPNSGDFSVYVPGVGRLRTEARSVAQLDELEREITAAGELLIHFELRRTSGDEIGRRTAVATAPVWMGLSIVFFSLFWPRRPTGPPGRAAGSLPTGPTGGQAARRRVVR